MIQQILKSWQENRGNLLLILGMLAGIAMCSVWYFQLIPEISFVGRGIPGTMVSASAQAETNPLVALIRVPPPPPEQSFPDARVVVEVYSPSDTLSQQFPPLLVQSIKLPQDGGLQAVVFNNLGPGQYAAVAYIDINDNGRFDFEEASSTSEPFCLARAVNASVQEDVTPTEDPLADDDLAEDPLADSSPVAPQDKSQADAAGQLPRGIFEVLPGQASLIEFAFN